MPSFLSEPTPRRHIACSRIDLRIFSLATDYDGGRQASSDDSGWPEPTLRFDMDLPTYLTCDPIAARTLTAMLYTGSAVG